MGQAYSREKYFLCLKKYFFVEKYFLTGVMKTHRLGAFFSNPKKACGGAVKSTPAPTSKWCAAVHPRRVQKKHPKYTFKAVAVSAHPAPLGLPLRSRAPKLRIASRRKRVVQKML